MLVCLIIVFILLVGFSQHVGYAEEVVTLRHLNQFELSTFLHEVYFHPSSNLVGCHEEQKSYCQSKLLVHELVEEEEIYFPSASPDSLLRTSLVHPYLKFVNKDFLNVEIYVDRVHQNFEPEILQIFYQSLVLETEQDGTPIVVECHCDDREPLAYSYTLGHRWGKMIQGALNNTATHPVRVELVNYGNEYGICDGDLGECQKESRLHATFKFLAIREPQSGCLIRLRLPVQRNIREMVFEDHPLFLQEIHMAGARTKLDP